MIVTLCFRILEVKLKSDLSDFMRNDGLDYFDFKPRMHWKLIASLEGMNNIVKISEQFDFQFLNSKITYIRVKSHSYCVGH